MGQIENNFEEAIDWAYGNGLVIRSEQGSIHVPISLNPTPFPSNCFHQAKSIQPIYNILVDRVARNHSVMTEIMDELSKYDDFTSKIYDIYKGNLDHPQKIWLGIHRSDYMVDYQNSKNSIKQVEMNTISVSFSSLASKVSGMHRYLGEKVGEFGENLPVNQSGTAIADGLAHAFKLYGNPTGVVMMVVQPGETNVFDQRWIEQQLFQRHGIRLIRKTLLEICSGTLNDSNELVIDGKVVAIAYFRAGYTPRDFPSELEWNARELIEKSMAIKCPNAAYHLVGTKKMQQVLANPYILSRFLGSKHQAEILETFTGLYPLDDSELGKKAIADALENPGKYVLKPQREGGGNNYYGEDILPILESKKNLNGYILMDLIKPPPLEATMIRKHVCIKDSVISELGIFGIFIA